MSTTTASTLCVDRKAMLKCLASTVSYSTWFLRSGVTSRTVFRWLLSMSQGFVARDALRPGALARGKEDRRAVDPPGSGALWQHWKRAITRDASPALSFGRS